LRNNFNRYIALYLVAMIILSLVGCNQKSDTSDSGVESGVADNASTAKEKAVIFSQSGGLYEREFLLELSTDIENGVLRYTLDGSDPTSESTEYTGGITIADRTSEDNLLSEMVTGSSEGGFGGNRPAGEEQNGEMPQNAPPDGEDVPSRQGATDNLDTTTENDARQRPDMGNTKSLGENSTSSTPTENVFKGTVIKAAVFSENGEMLSGISVQSYFVSEDIFTRYGDLPIVSIVTDADNFFDDETGIYTNYNESGSDWERPVYFEMFETDGTSVIAQDMGVRINGGTTRSLTQKALRFYAKSSYDEESPTIEYEIFDGLTTSYSNDPLTTFKRIILRSSGNDNSSTLFRDALMQSLVSNLNVDTQASRSCIAFLNGEFWGIYNIRERYDDYYFANHYDIDTGNVAILEISSGSSTPEINEGEESDLEYYNEMIEFFNNNSMTDEANYLKAQEYMDIDNLIDYYIANIYSGNTDWPANNNVFWRYKTGNGGYDETAEWYMDGRFRWVIKDMDWGFGLMGQAGSDTLSHAMNDSSSSTDGGNRGGGFTSAESTLLFRKLLENEEFKARFINRFCDVMNTDYEINTVSASINEMKTEMEDAIPEQSNRYPSSVSGYESWENNVNTMIEFAQQRTGYVQGFLQSKFSLADVVAITLKTDGNKGYIRINDTDITTATRGITDISSWNGSYFAGTTQTVTAVALDGDTFVKLVVTDTATGTTTEYTDSIIEITLGSGGTVVQAIFE